jgi:hypothetical protein
MLLVFEKRCLQYEIVERSQRAFGLRIFVHPRTQLGVSSERSDDEANHQIVTMLLSILVELLDTQEPFDTRILLSKTRN